MCRFSFPHYWCQKVDHSDPQYQPHEHAGEIRLHPVPEETCGSPKVPGRNHCDTLKPPRQASQNNCMYTKCCNERVGRRLAMWANYRARLPNKGYDSVSAQLGGAAYAAAQDHKRTCGYSLEQFREIRKIAVEDRLLSDIKVPKRSLDGNGDPPLLRRILTMMLSQLQRLLLFGRGTLPESHLSSHR